MKDYRLLSEEEIDLLEDNGCTAEDWTAINVSEDFTPLHIRNVAFYGEVKLGTFDTNIEVSPGFFKHSGIRNATLRNVTIGDNCLIENIGNFINNYVIGDDNYISNVNTIETTEGATFGQGNMISVLNEIGDGNILLFDGLSSQLAAFMIRFIDDQDLTIRIRNMVKDQINEHVPDIGTITNQVKIINTGEITNTHINDGCEINGACRLSDCTLATVPEVGVYIGSGVICENSIINGSTSVLNSAKVENCFIGEACQITNGFTAKNSVFFANCYMANGEACAAFCGPFTASHHKSSLLIGGMYSFYNAGSATNFSNHAYKMGPLHYGTIERGSKTASGAYLLMPAHIGTFSVCFGKLMYHPDTRSLPFSYLISYNDNMYLVPGRNLTTVGLYRDIRKWPRRDVRPRECQLSIINFDWLSPFSVGEILKAKSILENLRNASGENVSTYNYHEYVIKASSLQKGIKFYDIALRIYMGAVLKRHKLEEPTSKIGIGEWTDLSGLLMPESELTRLAKDIKSEQLSNIDEIMERFHEINENYAEYRWAWTYQMMLDYYGLDVLTEEDAERIRQDYVTARRIWIDEIKKDAEREYKLGDVEDKVIENFIKQLDKEIDFENQKLYM